MVNYCPSDKPLETDHRISILSLSTRYKSFYNAFYKAYFRFAKWALIVEAIATVIGVIASIILGAPSNIIVLLVCTAVMSCFVVSCLLVYGGMVLDDSRSSLQKLTLKSPSFLSRLWTYASLFFTNLMVLLGLVFGALLGILPFLPVLTGEVLLSAMSTSSLIALAIPLAIHAVLASAILIIVPAVIIIYIQTIMAILNDIWYMIFGASVNKLSNEFVSSQRFTFKKGQAKKMLADKSQKDFSQEQRNNRLLQCVEHETDSEEMPEDPTHISVLTRDNYVYMLGKLDDPNDLVAASRTCKYWHNLSRGNQLWYSLFQNTILFSGLKYSPERNYMTACFNLRTVYIIGPPNQKDYFHNNSGHRVASTQLADARAYFKEQGVESDTVACIGDCEAAEHFMSAHQWSDKSLILFEVEVLERNFQNGSVEPLQLDDTVKNSFREFYELRVTGHASQYGADVSVERFQRTLGTHGPAEFPPYQSPYQQKRIPWAAVRRVVAVTSGSDKFTFPEKLPTEVDHAEVTLKY